MFPEKKWIHFFLLCCLLIVIGLCAKGFAEHRLYFLLSETIRSFFENCQNLLSTFSKETQKIGKSADEFNNEDLVKWFLRYYKYQREISDFASWMRFFFRKRDKKLETILRFYYVYYYNVLLL